MPIGQMIQPVPTSTIWVQIISNEVSYGGTVFPSGVALLIHRTDDIGQDILSDQGEISTLAVQPGLLFFNRME